MGAEVVKLPEVSMGDFRIGSCVVAVHNDPCDPVVAIRVLLSGMVDVNNTQKSATTDMIEHVFADHWERMSHERRAQLIRRKVLEVVTHEVDEWLCIDGKRLTNPHETQTQRAGAS